MALTIETGTGSANSDSYISLVDARTYATNYGYSLSAVDADAEVQLRQGALYVNTIESQFSGDRVNASQSLAWPRVDATSCSGSLTIDVASDSVPVSVANAQVIAASTYASGVNPRASESGSSIASEEVSGVGKISYFNTGQTTSVIELTEVTDVLSQYLCLSQGLSLKAKRV